MSLQSCFSLSHLRLYATVWFWVGSIMKCCSIFIAKFIAFIKGVVKNIGKTSKILPNHMIQSNWRGKSLVRSFTTRQKWSRLQMLHVHKKRRISYLGMHSNCSMSKKAANPQSDRFIGNCKQRLSKLDRMIYLQSGTHASLEGKLQLVLSEEKSVTTSFPIVNAGFSTQCKRTLFFTSNLFPYNLSYPPPNPSLALFWIAERDPTYSYISYSRSCVLSSLPMTTHVLSTDLHLFRYIVSFVKQIPSFNKVMYLVLLRIKPRLLFRITKGLIAHCFSYSNSFAFVDVAYITLAEPPATFTDKRYPARPSTKIKRLWRLSFFDVRILIVFFRYLSLSLTFIFSL